MLSHEDGIVRVESYRWDIDIRKMVWTKDVLPFGIQGSPAFNSVRQKAEGKNNLSPPSVQCAGDPKLLFKKYRDEEKRKENSKEDSKNEEAVVEINPSKKVLHRVDKKTKNEPNCYDENNKN